MDDVVEAFIRRYVKEYDFYDQAARLVRQLLETELRTSGIRCMVTSRAKDVTRLEDKARQRALQRNYACADDVFEDIADLAGVRVALYFPGERDQVDSIVHRLFQLIDSPKEFPQNRDDDNGRRFSGYSARHYRVRLKKNGLSDSDQRYSAAKVEIQVASVLMHAWSEVEHDLVYKPLAGALSEDEYAILDQLNGMVIAGEIALETLQRAGKRRVADSGGEFRNHYELAAYLLAKIKTDEEKPVDESGLGRVDLLFALMKELGLNGPAKLAPYLEVLHGDLEARPLAEQVIDAVLAENTENYEVYRTVQNRADWLDTQRTPDRDDAHREVGLFLHHWSELENLIRIYLELSSAQVGYRSPILVFLKQHEMPLDPTERNDLNALRNLRNNLVHHGYRKAAADLSDATDRLQKIIEKLRRNLPRPPEPDAV
ncbi:RelA/SpoT domain-containing protein [Amycolatopsis minnesotensis]|uniref:RelA/SpoT domain-containing protein n=1 Tax=Amycolatopsis minnesotensis TaxID=337894 RepID=A0ABN2PY89_9PSEU